MSNDVKHEDSDLELDLEEESGASLNDRSMDAAGRSNEDSQDESEEDADSESLDLDEEDQDESEKPNPKREEEADRHAKSWAARILAGKATLADVPANHQYLLPKIEQILGVSKPKKVEKKVEKKEKPAPQVDRATLKKELAEDFRYDDLVEQLKAADLTPNQVQKFNERRTMLRSRGLSKLEATELAMEAAGIELDAEKVELPRIKMGSRPSSTPSGKKYDGSEDPNKMSRKELADFKAKQPRKR